MDLRTHREDVLDTTFRSSDGEMRFATRTVRSWGKKCTTIWRLNPHAKQRWQVAGIAWNSWSPTRVSFLRKEMELDVFLSSNDSTRSFTGPGGVRYMWVVQGDSKLLFDKKTGNLVAQSRWSESGPQRSLTLHLQVMPEAMPALNAIVVTFIILQKQMQPVSTLKKRS